MKRSFGIFIGLLFIISPLTFITSIMAADGTSLHLNQTQDESYFVNFAGDSEDDEAAAQKMPSAPPPYRMAGDAPFTFIGDNEASQTDEEGERKEEKSMAEIRNAYLQASRKYYTNEVNLRRTERGLNDAQKRLEELLKAADRAAKQCEAAQELHGRQRKERGTLKHEYERHSDAFNAHTEANVLRIFTQHRRDLEEFTQRREKGPNSGTWRLAKLVLARLHKSYKINSTRAQLESFGSMHLKKQQEAIAQHKAQTSAIQPPANQQGLLARWLGYK